MPPVSLTGDELSQPGGLNTGSHASTWPLAQFAMEQIDRFALPADPSSFELWFMHASGKDPLLSRAINDAIASADGLTEAKFERLCRLYLPSRRRGSGLSAVATGLSDEITQVMGMIKAAATSSEIYERQLDDGLVSFGELEGYDAVRPVVEALVVATRQMDAETQTLKLQLYSSQERAAHLQQEVELLRKENLTDPLTLIGNRQYFDETLAQLCATAETARKSLSLLFCDIDHFKEFNDKFGHQIGDQVLRLVAGLIKNSLTPDAVMGRYGGEEFGIILPNTRLEVAKMTAEKIRATLAMREVKKRHRSETFGRITISIGVAQLRPHESPDELVARADDCLYAAKWAGRNRVVSEDGAAHQADESRADNVF